VIYTPRPALRRAAAETGRRGLEILNIAPDRGQSQVHSGESSRSSQKPPERPRGGERMSGNIKDGEKGSAWVPAWGDQARLTPDQKEGCTPKRHIRRNEKLREVGPT